MSLDRSTDAFQAAAACGIQLEQPCAGTSACGRCRLRVTSGAGPPSDADIEALSTAEIRAGWRLGCSLILQGAATIEVPPSTQTIREKSFGADLGDDPGRVPIIERPVGPRGDAWGLAIDIGTTSLASALIDLRTGRVMASASALNPQVASGADVMSRIFVAGRGETDRSRLETAVRSGISRLLQELLTQTDRRGDDIVAATVVGNPTMLHLWCGADPSGLGTAPYAGSLHGPLHGTALQFGLPILDSAPVYAFPGIRSHVGADALAAAVATDLDRVSAPVLLMDLGTNSELVLAGAGGVLAASTAAGPAFEGAGIRCGMRAGPGAVDALHLDADGRWSLHVIGEGLPLGVCGSGLLDAVAELLRAGVLDRSGSMRSRDAIRDVAPEALRSALGDRDGRRYVTIAGAGAPVPALNLEATDIRQIQLATGAVRAGVDLLLREAALAPSDVSAVLVAGVFGSFVRKRSLLQLGLVPDVRAERVRTVGNAAGLGARLALLDRRVRERAERLAERAVYVELAGRPDYQEALIDRLRFPEPLPAPGR